MNATIAPGRHAFTAVILSASCWTIAGVAWVLGHWWATDPLLALERASLCLLLIVVTHWIGYRAFARQSLISLTDDARRSLRLNLLCQGLMLAVSAVALDNGALMHVVLISSGIYWIMVGMIISRRAPALSCSDNVMLELGWLIVGGIGGMLTPFAIGISLALR